MGDIESLPFLEAIRQFPVDVGRRRCMYIHLTLVPVHRPRRRAEDEADAALGQRAAPHRHRSPTCSSAAPRASSGVDIRKKIALFASLRHRGGHLRQGRRQHLQGAALVRRPGRRRLHHASTSGSTRPSADLDEWREITRRADEAKEPVHIAIVGKYVQLEDAYLSVSEALRHSGYLHGGRIEIDWVDSETLEDEETALRVLGDADGILVPGGFGGRGIEGKIRAVKVAREQRIPYLGHLPRHADRRLRVRPPRRRDGRRELDRVRHRDRVPVIDLLPEQKEVSDLGGTMRLGADPIKLHADTRARDALRRGGRLRAPPPPLRGLDLAAQAPRGRRPRRLGHVARTSASSRSSSSPTTRSSSPRSSTRSSSRVPSARRRCSASSSPPRWSAPASARPRAARSAPRARPDRHAAASR